ncbi:MAG: hypothetical protein DF168_01079 [Candidatus Moanabacter tarae]|uniref:Uncharacterized protein n=1 Tax=Candidatus Moanibacter tarae TaxID=2200854 RepID=A0A2Z4AQ12_9BACT|nr:MAG: hypothetical protein DF168_01079 [Candidatus Moanabacter tarae]
MNHHFINKAMEKFQETGERKGYGEFCIRAFEDVV